MATVPQDGNGNVLRYRLDNLERNYERVEKKLDALQARFTGLIITLACSAVVFALTVLAGTGRL